MEGVKQLGLVREGVIIDGICLRYVGGENDPHARVIVEVEWEGEWVEVINEAHASAFDHRVTAYGIREALIQAQVTRCP